MGSGGGLQDGGVPDNRNPRRQRKRKRKTNTPFPSQKREKYAWQTKSCGVEKRSQVRKNPNRREKSAERAKTRAGLPDAPIIKQRCFPSKEGET